MRSSMSGASAMSGVTPSRADRTLLIDPTLTQVHPPAPSVMAAAGPQQPPPNPEVEALRATINVREVSVELSLPASEEVDISLTPNLVIKSIRTPALHSQLIVGDQLLLVNGRAPNNVAEAYRLLDRQVPKRVLVVGRVGYKQPVPDERAAKIQLKRQSGHSYFLLTVKRAGSLRLGLSVRKVRGKLVVHHLEEGGLAAHTYLLGDVIHDINGERMATVEQSRRRITDHIRKERAFSTVVERVDSPVTTYNFRLPPDPYVLWELDGYEMTMDAKLIGQREAVRHRVCAGNRRKARGIVAGGVDKTQENTITGNPKDAKNKRRRSTPGNSARFEYLDTSSSRRKKQKKKKVLINATKNEEEKISSDVPSTVFLQHVASLNKQGRMASLTFMPKLFRSN